MDRAAKQELVTTLHDVFKDTGVVVVAHYAGMTVAQMTEFRKRMKEAGGAVKVAKNTLAVLALKETDSEGISGLFKGQTCIAYSSDPVAAARIAVKYSRENEKLVILGGAMGKNVLDSNSVKALADLPSLDELSSSVSSTRRRRRSPARSWSPEPSSRALCRRKPARKKLRDPWCGACRRERLEHHNLDRGAVRTELRNNSNDRSRKNR